MPIRPDLLHFYRTASYREARKRIQARAKDACERCGKYNGASVETAVGKVLQGGKIVSFMFWRIPGADLWHSQAGNVSSAPKPSGEGLFKRVATRMIRVKCGAAHLNHVPGDDRDVNLAWLCDWCHFHHDRQHHHETRGARKDELRPILAAAGVKEVA